MSDQPLKTIRTVILAKAPIAGLAKTRLIPVLGREGSAALARQLLLHAIEQALNASIGPVELCVTPAPTDPVWRSLAVDSTIIWSEQGDGDLGERMARVSQRVTANNEILLLIGSDCPALEVQYLRQAAAALHKHDACLLPVSDGGYALLGAHQHLPSLFSDMPWSTATVAQITCARMVAANWTLQLLPELHDIDEPEDLQWLPVHLQPLRSAT